MTHRPGFRALDKDLGRIGHAEVAQMHAFRPVWRLGWRCWRWWAGC